MSDYLTALTGAGTTVAVGVTYIARSFRGTPVAPARHRAAGRLPSEETLIGPPSAYTAVDSEADTHVFGVLKTGFGWCPDCGSTTAGVISRNGFRCGEFAQHPAGGAA